MSSLMKQETMALQQTPDDSLIKLGEWFIVALSFVILVWKFIDKYFEDKKTQKKEFIAEVVRACIQSELTEVKDNIKELKTFRENDRKYFDDKFDKVMTLNKRL